jgi:outer membrane receptor for ferrienterochelin and colicins
MVERVEVVRGGASALYGSSAIGGTVNIITRMPKRNSYEITSIILEETGKIDRDLAN